MANVRKNELTDFGRQVKNILSEKKITQSQLGETLGIAQNSLSTRLSRYEIGYDKMMDIANALGYEINLELVPIVNKSNTDTNITTIPVSVVAAGAGISTPFTSDDDFKEMDFSSDIVPESADCGVRINGDSMSPKYPDGCIVWVKKNTELQYGDEAIVVLNGCPFFKIYEKDGLYSINSNYIPIKVYDTDKCYIFGKVIGSYQE